MPHCSHSQSSGGKSATTRREFLRLGSHGLGLLALGNFLPVLATKRLSAEETGNSRRNNILVLVQLVGGNDGLNTLVPFTEDRYYRLRPTLAIPEQHVLKLDDNCGLHPACEGMRDLYERGHLAILQGVGYARPNRSHFGSGAIWETGSNADHTFSTGWLGRFIDQTSPEVSLQTEPVAMHFSQQTPSCLAGENEASGIHAFEQPASEPASYQAAIDRALRDYRPVVTYPSTRFGTALRRIASMVSAGFSTRIYHVNLGGFDTHSLQALPHQNLLKQLSDGLAAFQKDLRLQRLDAHVLTTTYSEFGRRAGENERRGTGHGTAAPVFVIGASVNGGLYGKAPSLPDDHHEDMAHDVEHREVYATLLENWLGMPAESVLGRSEQTLGFL